MYLKYLKSEIFHKNEKIEFFFAGCITKKANYTTNLKYVV